MSRIIGQGVGYEDVLIVPSYNKVQSRNDVDLTTRVTRNHNIQLPFISANMDSVTEKDMALAMNDAGGLGVLHRFMSVEKQTEQIITTKEEDNLVAVAIGVKNYEQIAPKLIDAGADILVLDIAHGHSKYAGKAIDWLKTNCPNADVVAGNIATKDAADYFLSKGADAVKVGIGPGFACTTRRQTGVGVPQITAIMDVYESTQGEIPIIADGGIREPGDVVKAIGAGANSVMSGYMFAGCNEVPMIGSNRNTYRGSASFDTGYVEGIEVQVKNKGPIEKVINEYEKGLRSGLTYNGKSKLEDFVGKADFILK